MVQNPGDMANLRGGTLGDRAEQQVVVLAAFETLAKTADRFEQRPAVQTEVGHVVLTVEELGIEVWFEMRSEPATIFVESVLVGVDDLGVWMCQELLGSRIEGVFSEFVVVVEQRHVVASCQCKSGVTGCADVAVGLAVDHANATILRRVTVQHCSDVGGG